MPNRQLTQQDNFETISTWLAANLINPFGANMQSLPPEDNSRGIYFWFMKPGGYQKLSALGLNITAINPNYKKIINEETYDLVYTGTAGANRKESNTLFKRMDWHLSDKHNENNICHGTISTLRHTVGSALSDDLIIPNTENDVNEFFSDYFYVYTLPYSGEANTKEQIDNDEYYLITLLNPLFNIKNNPNARITAGQNPTRQLKVRRGLVMQNTRERLGCKKGNNGKAKSNKDDIKPPKSPINNYELIYDKDGCQEFTVAKDQSVHNVISGIEGLPTSKCEIVIYNSADPNMFIYNSKHNNGKRVTGDKKISIYGYFNNIDTNKNNQPRWKVIQQEMLDKGMEEITVRVYSDKVEEEKVVENNTKKKSGKERSKKTDSSNSTQKTKTQKVAKTKAEFISELERINLGKNFKIVFTCANRKYEDTDLIYEYNQIEFKWEENHQINRYNPFDYIPVENIRWSVKLQDNNQEFVQIPQAFELYKPKIYGRLRNCFGDRFFIASAGWGIVKSDFRLPNYDVTFSANAINTSSYRDSDMGFENDLNDLEIINNPEDITSPIVFLGPAPYIKQFVSLTQNLPNRKIIFTNSELNRNLINILNQNATFEYHFLNMTASSIWYKIIAGWFCEIYCQQNNEANI